MKKLVTSCLLISIFITSATHAQQKKNLTSDEYGKWQSLGSTELSPNGEWVAYQVTVQEDNDTLYVSNRLSQKTYKLDFSSSPAFSKDNQWIVYRIGLAFKDAENLRAQSKPVEYKMGLLNLFTGKKEVIQNINRFEFSRNGKFLVAYLNPQKKIKTKLV